jgi:hypothetical protein
MSDREMDRVIAAGPPSADNRGFGILTAAEASGREFTGPPDNKGLGKNTFHGAAIPQP